MENYVEVNFGSFFMKNVYNELYRGGDMMQITNLDKEQVLACAQAAFPNLYIELDTADFYIPSIEQGKIQVEGEKYPFYVSTHYAYEDRLVNKNQTRFKVTMTVFFVKQDPYEVLYDTTDKYYVAFLEDDTLSFLAYETFHAHIIRFIKKLEEE